MPPVVMRRLTARCRSLNFRCALAYPGARCKPPVRKPPDFPQCNICAACVWGRLGVYCWRPPVPSQRRRPAWAFGIYLGLPAITVHCLASCHRRLWLGLGRTHRPSPPAPPPQAGEGSKSLYCSSMRKLAKTCSAFSSSCVSRLPLKYHCW